MQNIPNRFNKFKSKLIINIFTGETIGPFMVLCILILGVWILVGPSFFGSYNIFSILRQVGFIGIVALGEALIMITGGIDLSVGAVAGFSGIISAWFMVNTGIDPYICLTIGMIVGLIAGYINGILIVKLKVNPFIVTLGFMQIYFSFNVVITKGLPITNISRNILWIGQGRIGFMPMPAIILIILVIILEIILRYNKLGRKLYAIGENSEASLLSGLKVNNIKIAVYTLGGFFAALGGLTSLARFSSGQPSLGDGWELIVIPAFIIGGGSLEGGKGSAFGALIGIMVLTIVKQVIVVLNFSSFWQDVVIGSVIILAVLIDILRRRIRRV